MAIRYALSCLLLVGACSNEANHLGNPMLLPVHGISSLFQNAAYNQRRGQVEIEVKSNFPQMISEIEAGGGPALSHAMDLAQVPSNDRPARRTQLQGDLPIYRNNPEALIVALMVYGT